MSRRKQDFSDWLCRQQGVMPRTALRYVLEAMIPFTEANMKFAFKPNAFFNELDKIEFENRTYSKASIRRAYYEAKKRGLIAINEDGSPVISEDAKRQLSPFKPRTLKGAQVMVVFDIPETSRRKRQWFRLLLRELKFQQIQKSVWVSEFDCFEVLSAGILEQRLEEYVRVFEARPIESQ